MATPQGPNARSVTDAAHRVAVGIDVSDLVGRLEREAARLISDFSQQGLEGEALADAVVSGLRDLSDAPVDRAARGAAGEAFNLGRNLAAQEHPEIARAVRTEILDRNTCEPCRELDGKVVEMNSDEYFEFMPPNQCEGREQCRGFYLLLTEEPAALVAKTIYERREFTEYDIVKLAVGVAAGQEGAA